MKHTISYLTVFALLPAFLFAQAPDTLWTKTYGTIYNDVGRSVQQTTDGGYIILGASELLGPGNFDVYLIKTNTSGDTVWTKDYGGTFREYGYSLQQTTDGGYIIVGDKTSPGASSNVYLMKTDSLGDTLWTKQYNMGSADGYDRGRAVQQTADGGYVIAAYYYWFPFTMGDEVWLIKTDSNGVSQWTKTYGGDGQDRAYSIQHTDDGGYVVVGYYEFGPNGDIWLLKTDSLLDTLWTRTYGGPEDECGYSAQQTEDGGYIIAGYTYSFGGDDVDIYLVKTDSIGDTLWTRTYGGSEDDFAYSAQQTMDLGYIIVGCTGDWPTFPYDVYVIKTDSAGDIIWSDTYGGTGWDEGFSVQQTDDTGYIIAGYTESFGVGGEDVYLIKTGPDPGIEEDIITKQNTFSLGPTIISGPLLLPEGKTCRVYDISGREVDATTLAPGVYFVEVEGRITNKVIKVR